MKAKYTGTIREVSKKDDEVEITVAFSGTVEGFQSEAKKTSMDVVLRLKPVVADKLTFGSTFILTLTDEEPEPSTEILRLVSGPLSGGLQ